MKFKFLFICMVFVNMAYAESDEGKGSAGWKPPLIPIEVTIDEDGDIDVAVTDSINTPIGTFSASYGKTIFGDRDYGKWMTPSTITCKRNGGTFGCIATWEDAKKICSDSKGRLPTIDELEKVVTDDCNGKLFTYPRSTSNDSENNYANSYYQTVVNIDNPNYQSCYADKGFRYGDGNLHEVQFWASSTDDSTNDSKDDKIYPWTLIFDGGAAWSIPGGTNTSAVRCIKD